MHGLLVALGMAALSYSLCGCTTKAKAQADARMAYLAGQQQALMQMQAQNPSVTVNGNVRNKIVPWTEGLTLARAIVTAEYLGTMDPREIILVHRGIASRIDPKKLLEQEGPTVQPGDIVELR